MSKPPVVQTKTPLDSEHTGMWIYEALRNLTFIIWQRRSTDHKKTWWKKISSSWNTFQEPCRNLHPSRS